MNDRIATDKPIIDPKTHPMWTATGFVVALLALVLSLVGIYRTNVAVVATQTEVLALDLKVRELSKTAPPASPPTASERPVQ